jgi:hypothetical protein
MEIGYSCDPDTATSYCPFFLLKKWKTGANFLDTNLIRVAPECHDTGGLACLYHGTFGQKYVLLEVIKEYLKKDARDWSSLTD